MKRLHASLIIRAAGLVILFGLLYVALFPHRASACDTFDVGCPVDVGIYSLIVGVSEGLWAWNRAMLYLARLVEGLRTWLISDVLGTALDATVAGMKFPFWIAVGIAWIVFTVSFLIQAVMRLDWVDLRKGIRNAIFAVILFQAGSQAMAGLEQIRITVGQGFQAIASTSVGDATTQLGFYVGSASSRGDSIEPPHSIYDGADTCPGIDLTRTNGQSMFMNDYLANFLFADAHDIHCPNGAGAALPDNYVNTFQIDTNQISNEDADARARRTILARMGLARQAQAVLPTIGAVLEQVMHLVFALALASLWFGLVISMMFSLFLPTEGMFKTQIDGMLATLKASWLASFWVGIGMSLVAMASATGNALAVNGITIGMFIVYIFQIRGAILTLRGAMVSTSATLGQAPSALGGLARGFGRLAADGAIVGAAWATGNKAELAEAGLQQMRRRLAFSTSGNLIAQAGERLLLNKAMGPVERWVQDEKDARAVGQREDEATWYEQRLKNPKLTEDEKGRVLRRTDEIDTEIEDRQVASTKRSIQQARATGSWDRADKLQKKADEQEINRLERKIDEAQKSGDPKQMAAIPKIQERIDFLRGVPSAAVDAANGTVGVSAVNGQRSEPLAIGLQEVSITRASGGQLSVNGHTITSAQLSTDGHRVTLSAGNRAIDIGRDDAAAANGLEVGKVLTVPANVRDPNGDSEGAPHAGGNLDVRADLELRIQEGQRQERALMGQRDTAFEEHRFTDARKLSEQINALRAQMVTDRKALASLDRDRPGDTGVRVSAPPALATSAVSLSPSDASADDLAYVPPPGAEDAGTPPSSPADAYQHQLSTLQEQIAAREQQLEGLRAQYQQQFQGGNMEAAGQTAGTITRIEQAQRLSQETYNRIALAPPTGVTPAPQIVVGASGVLPAAQPTTGPVIVQAPSSGEAAAAPAAAMPAATVASGPAAAAPAPAAVSGPAAPSAQPVMVSAPPAAVPPAAVAPAVPPMASPPTPAAPAAVSGPAAPAPSAQPVMVSAPPAAAQQATAPAPAPAVQPPSTPAAPVGPAVASGPAAPSAQPVKVPAPALQPASATPGMVQPPVPATPAVTIQAPPVQRAPSADLPAVQAPIPSPVTPAGPLHPSMVPPHARPAERPVPPAETPATRLDPSMVPPGVGEPRQAPPAATGTLRTAKPRPWKNRERRRNGSRGGSGGTS
jgi:hypothetical protein